MKAPLRALRAGSALPLFVCCLVAVGMACGPPDGREKREAGPEGGETAARDRMLDFHAHVFNSHYLPIEGILRNRGLPKEMSNCLHRWLNEHTCPGGDLRAMAGLAAVSDDSLEEDLAEAGIGAEEFRAEVLDVLTRDSPEMAVLVAEDAAEPELLDLLEVLLSTSLESDPAIVDDDEEIGEEVIGPASIPGFRRFLDTVRSCEGDQLARLRADLPAARYVLHMMDLQNVYRYDDSLPPSYDLETQWQRMADLAASEPDVELFAAFDPFRFSRIGKLDELEKIKDRVAGVKFYPPSGYRPSSTELPPNAGQPPADARYGHLGDPSTVELWRETFSTSLGLTEQEIDELVGEPKAVLDRINLVFFRWAKDNRKPIFSHHTTHGFQAGKGYGKRFADPAWWYPILEADQNLRLVLAHSGGASWFANEAKWEGSFGYNAYRLCVLFEHVYCDFGYFDEVRSPSKRERFSDRLVDLLALDAGADDSIELPKRFAESHILPHRFPLGSKILYGSDWFMVQKRKHFKKIPADLEGVFARPELATYRDRFFFQNAEDLLSLP